MSTRLPEDTSGSMSQSQTGSLLKSVAQVATRANLEVWDLDQRLRLGWTLRTMSQQGPYRYGWTVLPPGVKASSGSRLLLRAMSGSIALWQPESGLTYGEPVATKHHEEAQGQISNLSPRARKHPGLSGLHCYTR